ncbi:MAG: hypothetical protein RQ729_01120 [Wenzhouxiangellaceae bacterium]|nr:hypothetical protein [Wenzhouxiangellaceae bacterium]
MELSMIQAHLQMQRRMREADDASLLRRLQLAPASLPDAPGNGTRRDMPDWQHATGNRHDAGTAFGRYLDFDA